MAVREVVALLVAVRGTGAASPPVGEQRPRGGRRQAAGGVGGPSPPLALGSCARTRMTEINRVAGCRASDASSFACDLSRIAGWMLCGQELYSAPDDACSDVSPAREDHPQGEGDSYRTPAGT